MSLRETVCAGRGRMRGDIASGRALARPRRDYTRGNPSGSGGQGLAEGEHAPRRLRRHRRRKEVALGVVAAEMPQDLPLRLRLHALGDDAQPQVVAELDDGADDLRALAPARELGHEGTVDLQGVHRQAVEVAEARAARAEVVDAPRKVEPAPAGPRR